MFEEKPDYNYLKSLFKTVMQRNGYDYDGRYDWIVKKEGGEKHIQAMLKTEQEKQRAMPSALPPRDTIMTQQRQSKEHLMRQHEERKESRGNIGA